MTNKDLQNMHNDYMKRLEDEYIALIQPKKLIEHFKDIEEFKEWAELGTPADIRAAIKAFEKDELFIHCVILNDVLNTKEK